MTEKEKRNAEILSKYIPEKAVPQIVRWIYEYDFKLKISKERSSKLGDYRPPYESLNHQITVNYNLNPYSFLVTLVHEIGHLTCYNKFKNRVQPHGPEWKYEYKAHLSYFLTKDIFPDDVLFALMIHLEKPGASSCSDHQLHRVLKRYDIKTEETRLVFLEKLPYRTKFLYQGNRLFEKGLKVRTRFHCLELSTGKLYLFNALAEVELAEPVSHPESSIRIDI